MEDWKVYWKVYRHTNKLVGIIYKMIQNETTV